MSFGIIGYRLSFRPSSQLYLYSHFLAQAQNGQVDFLAYLRVAFQVGDQIECYERIEVARTLQ